MLPDININDFDYDLPESRIAKYPLKNRAESKLLLANTKSKTISHHIFKEVIDLLPENTSLYLNKTKVISGRFIMQKETGGKAELLLVEPIEPSNDPQITLQSRNRSVWKAIIGGRRIRVGTILNDINGKINAEILKKEANEVTVELNWGEETLSEILLDTGVVPLPPYLNREAEESDRETYQTIFAEKEGSIAAPTAGLHFTDDILSALKEKGIKIRELTLHVGPGTFLPVSSDDVREHKMHSEMFSISKNTLDDIVDDLESENKIVCVGTTSIRTLESLYWIGNDIESFNKNNIVSQWKPYQSNNMTPQIDAVKNIIQNMQGESLNGKTELIIVPGYDFKFADGLFTNFHVPKSTLLLLVSAFVGNMWQDIYKEALDNDYRMLSYGDASLLWK